jgi:hypothetical protein
MASQLVRLNSSQGEITRMVVKDLGEIITVCTPQELASAKDKFRQPLTIWFPKKDVLGRE